MKNQYVGDIGDYGKYGLLRFLAERGVPIGINWYLTENDDSTDGKFTKYLENPEEAIYNEIIFSELKRVGSRLDKSVLDIESAGLIPDAVFYNEFLPDEGADSRSRETNRRLWFNNSLLLLKDAKLVFADPDNGISYRKKPGSKGSGKYVLPKEIAEYYSRGQNVVFYCHKGRRTENAWEQDKVGIKEYLPDAQLIVLTFHRGTQRSYIFVLHPDDYKKYEVILGEFVSSVWGRLFTRESVNMNADMFSSAHIAIEILQPEFTICKVPDYSGVDMEQPFVFSGSTDEEKSLVCPTGIVPGNTVCRDDGWKAFRISGELDFSLIGILAEITRVLANAQIGIFAVSTYNTDYVFVKTENFKNAIVALTGAGYQILSRNE